MRALALSHKVVAVATTVAIVTSSGVANAQITAPGDLLFAGPGDAKLRGRLIEQSGTGQAVFLPTQPGIQAFGVEIPRALGESLKASDTDLPELEIKFRKPQHGFMLMPVVEEAQLPSVRLLEANQEALNAENLQDLRRSLLTLQNVSGRALGPSTSVTLEALEVKQLETLSVASTTLNALADVSAVAPPPVRDIETAMEVFLTLLHELKRPGREACANRAPSIKAIYCRESRYSIESYRAIATISHGVVGIGQKVGSSEKFKPTCSGSLIGENLVLTSAHCLLIDKKHHDAGFHSIDDFRVVFDYEESSVLEDLQRNNVPIKRVLHPDLSVRTSLPEHDFVLLEIETTPEPKGLMALAGKNTSRQICLSTRDIEQNQGTYLLGHPMLEERQVADFGRVLFPFRVRSESKLDELGKKVLYDLRQELDTVDEQDVRLAALGASPTETKELKAFKLWQRWEKSYVKTPSGFEHFSLLWRGQATIGLEIDGYSGNSGGPVMDRASHRQIGVFREGQRDTSQILLPSWQTHEAALPVEFVLSDMMSSTHPDWMESYLVCVFGRNGASTRLWSDDNDLKRHCREVCL